MAKPTRKQFPIITSVGFMLSMIWENLHFSLYTDYAEWMKQIFFVLCAFGDVVLICLVYLLSAAFLKNLFWSNELDFRKVILTLTISGIISFIAEKSALLLGWWSYSDNMPILPIANIGLSPFLAIAVLPLTTFLLSREIYQRL